MKQLIQIKYTLKAYKSGFRLVFAEENNLNHRSHLRVLWGMFFDTLMFNNSTYKVWCLFSYYVVVLNYKSVEELSGLKLCYFGPFMANLLRVEPSSLCFPSTTLVVNKAYPCCWNRDYEELLANTLITFVTAESNDRKTGWGEGYTFCLK